MCAVVYYWFVCFHVCLGVWVFKHLWPEGIWSFLSGFPSFLYIFYICDLTTSSWLYGFVVQCFERRKRGAEGVFRFLKHLPFVLFLCVLLQRTWVDCCTSCLLSVWILVGGGRTKSLFESGQNMCRFSCDGSVVCCCLRGELYLGCLFVWCSCIRFCMFDVVDVLVMVVGVIFPFN